MRATRKHDGQLPMFDPEGAGAIVLGSGRLMVAHCPDGRVMLWMETARGGAWLELATVEDRRWLIAALQAYDMHSVCPAVLPQVVTTEAG